MATSLSVQLDTRRIKKDGTFPIRLRVTFERKHQYFAIPHCLSIKMFEKSIKNHKNLSDDERELRNRILDFEKKADDIIKNMPFFQWAAFKKKYNSNSGAKNIIDHAFTDYCDGLKSEGRIGSAVAYKCAQTSLRIFNPDARFSDITPEFLRAYEAKMLKEEKSMTTIGMYLRSLRSIYNNAIADGIISKEYYPFGKKKYEIPTGRNIKKALTLKDIKLIFDFKTIDNSIAQRSKDYWIFMYLCNGMNVKDFCLLKYENLKDDRIEFIRAKTIRTKRTTEPIVVIINDFVTAIIKKWGNKPRDKGNYIFPILEAGLNPEEERKAIQNATHLINTHMKSIGEELGIERLTTYVARHSFATILMRSGVSVQFIGNSLGHGNVNTTQNYLAGFEDESKKEAIRALTDFGKIKEENVPLKKSKTA